MSERTPLDPPPWFWEVIDRARGDEQRLGEIVAQMDRRRVTLLYSYFRDLAVKLTGPDYQPYMAEGASDDGEFEVGLWVVTQGRDHYRAVVRDPEKIPGEVFPGTRSERAMHGKIAQVYYDRFHEEIPTDFFIGWNEDGSPQTV
jgi:hypothetical protein